MEVVALRDQDHQETMVLMVVLVEVVPVNLPLEELDPVIHSQEQ